MSERLVRKIDPHAVMVIFRKGLFYTVFGVEGVDLRQQASDNAALNPGTLRIEDADGNVLWRPQ